MSDALSAALRRRLELEAELAEVDRFIQLYRKFDGRADHHAVSPRPRTRGGDSPQSVADAAEAVLATASRPMNRNELLAALAEKGISLRAKNPQSYLNTILWRHSDRFRNVPRVGYVLQSPGLPRDVPAHDLAEQVAA